MLLITHDLELSLIHILFQYLFFYIGLAHTSGVKGAIIVGTNSLAAILIASLIFHQEKLTVPKTAGCLVGLAGVVAANLSGSGTVSYTHLDVYKRQGIYKLKLWIWYGDRSNYFYLFLRSECYCKCNYKA